LAERLKQEVKFFLGDSNPAVPHLEPQDDILGAFAEFADLHGDLTALGEFDRVADQIQQHLAQTAGVTAQTLRRFGIDRHGQFEILAPSLFDDEIDRPFDRRGQFEVDLFKNHLAGGEFGKIENFVNQRQQRFAALAHIMREVALLRIKLRVEQQTGHPDNRVERSADLVAHVSQEFRLHAGGLESGVARRGQLSLDAHAVADIVRGD
jgi:hypothetical protein